MTHLGPDRPASVRHVVADSTLDARSHTLTVTATDEAGNTATKSVEYLVGTGQCVSSPAAPANLKRWFMFDGNLSDSISGLTASGSISNGTFRDGHGSTRLVQ